MRSFKQLFILFFLITGTLNLDAQKKTVLVEHFTNTKCPICKNNNPGFYSRFSKYKDDAIHIAIHPSVPYNTCAFYLANKDGNGARQSNYTLFGTPTVFMNGKAGASNLPSDAEYVAAIAEKADYTIEFIKNNAQEVSIRVKTLKNLNSGATLVGFMALTEKHVFYNAPNGETEHFDVFRKFLRNSNNGEEIVFPAGSPAGTEIEHSFGAIEYTIATEGDFNVINWLVVKGSKDILQAAKSEIGSGASTNSVEFEKIKITSFPNPVADELNFEWEENDFNPQKIQVFAENGSLQLEKQLTPNKKKASLNVQQLAPGVYLFKITASNNKLAQGKFIVK